eukprot:GEMP01010564.1.p1 GENE.GEMP01010564.1~~GEMP01010564.1.p1  ORF type:complete len:974 (-),score=249.98 GEMP01010564.1:201-3122(-)
MTPTDASAASPSAQRVPVAHESEDGSVQREPEGGPSARSKCTRGMQVHKGMQVPEEYAAKGLVINEFDEVCCSRCHRGPLRTAEQIEEHVQLHGQMDDFSEAMWKKHGFQIVWKGKLGCTWCPEGPFDTPLQAFKHVNSPFHKKNAVNLQGMQMGELMDDYREDGITVQNGVGFCVCGAGPFLFACHIDVHVHSAKHLKFRRTMDEMGDTIEPGNVTLQNEQNMFVCTKCTIALPTEESYTEHLLGQRHKRACAAAAEEAVEMQPEWENEGIVRTERGAFCSKCDKILHTTEDVVAHLSGRTHNRKLLSFFGIITRMFPEGYAFIHSKDASAKYGAGDVFIPAALVAMERLDVGDPVRFSLDMIVNEDTNSNQLVVNYIEVCDRHQPRNEEINRVDGVIKSFCEENGYGFIACPSLMDKYGRDVFVNFKQIPNELRHVGQRVSFEVTVNRRGQPQAQKVEDATVHYATVVTNEDGQTFFHCTQLGKHIFVADASGLENDDIVQFKLDDDSMPYDVMPATEEDVMASAKDVPPKKDACSGDLHAEDGACSPQHGWPHQTISASNGAPPTVPDSTVPASAAQSASVEKPATAAPTVTVASTLNLSKFSLHTADVNRKEELTAQIKTRAPTDISLPPGEKSSAVRPPQQSQVDGRVLPRPLAPPVPKASRTPAGPPSASSTDVVSRVLTRAPTASSNVVVPEVVPRVALPLTPTHRATPSVCPPSPPSAALAQTPATIPISLLPCPPKGPDLLSRPTTASSGDSGHDKEDLAHYAAQSSSDEDSMSKAEREKLKKERKRAKKQKEENRRAAQEVLDDASVSVISKKDKKRKKERKHEREDKHDGRKSLRSLELQSAQVASAAVSPDWRSQSNMNSGGTMAPLAPSRPRVTGPEDACRAPSLSISGVPGRGSDALGSVVCSPRLDRGRAGTVTQCEDADFLSEQKTASERVASNRDGQAVQDRSMESRPTFLNFSSN